MADVYKFIHVRHVGSQLLRKYPSSDVIAIQTLCIGTVHTKMGSFPRVFFFFKCLMSEMSSTHCFLRTENRSICLTDLKFIISHTFERNRYIAIACTGDACVIGPFSRKRNPNIKML